MIRRSLKHTSNQTPKATIPWSNHPQDTTRDKKTTTTLAKPTIQKKQYWHHTQCVKKIAKTWYRQNIGCYSTRSKTLAALSHSVRQYFTQKNIQIRMVATEQEITWKRNQSILTGYWVYDIKKNAIFRFVTHAEALWALVPIGPVKTFGHILAMTRFQNNFFSGGAF